MPPYGAGHNNLIYRILCGIVTGPYYCAQYDEIIATSDCMDTYQNINVSALAVYMLQFASTDLIDAPGNMSNDRVLILSGMNDSTVLQGHTPFYSLQIIKPPLATARAA